MTTLVQGTKLLASQQLVGVAEFLLSRTTTKLNTTADGGVAAITIPGVVAAQEQRWNVLESFKVYSDSSEETTLVIYEGEIAYQNFIGGTNKGNLNEWVENPEIWTQQDITLQWTGCSAGAVCYVRAQYRTVSLVPVGI